MLKLSEFIRGIYAPTYWYGLLSPKTIENYLISVCRYIEIVGDLPLNEITPYHNARFVLGLKQFGQSLETERKHCRHLNTIFLKMGPPGPRHRDSMHVIPVAPWIRPPQPFRKLPREIGDSIADSLYNAVPLTPECFLYPTYLEAELRPNWWRAMITLITTSAIRLGVVFGLRWADLDIGQKYFIVPAGIDKKKAERRKPLHQEVLRLLESVRENEFLLSWSHGKKRFYEIWHRINEVGDIMPHITPHDLKRYSLQLASRSGVDVATLKQLGDHANIETTFNHYVPGNLERYIETVRLPGSGLKSAANESEVSHD